MVVAHPRLVPRRAARGLDAAEQSTALQRVQRVVDGLQGHLADAIAHSAMDGFHVEVVASIHGVQYREPSRGHPKSGLAKAPGVVHSSHVSSTLE
ncbi:hypothetical protein Mro03_14150 [Microbispora rosea subsp. rosea]|nr:hypothetical protein Mro03_14150 [Microbispora rosea subsp. rosea]